ncbi:MAG: translocation/assembly module TamB domain-containing protein [Pseudobdellovibrionaceae bacterium]
MKIFKRTLLGILSLLLVIVLVLTGAVFWAFKNPKNAWELVESHFLPKDLKVTWQNMDFKVHHISGLNFEMDWRIEGLIILKGRPFLHIPIKDLHLNASVFPRRPYKKLIIHDLQIMAPDLIQLQLENPAKKSPEKNPFQLAQNIFSEMRKANQIFTIENLNWDIAQVHLATGASTGTGTVKPAVFYLQAQNAGGYSAPENIRLVFGVRLPVKKNLLCKIKANFKMSNIEKPLPFLTGNLRVGGAGVSTWQIFSVATLNSKTSLVSVGLTTYTTEKNKFLIQQKLRLDLNPEEVVNHLEANISGLPLPLAKIDHIKVTMKTPLSRDVIWSEKPSNFTATAPIALFFIDSDMRRPLEKSCECKIPEMLQFELKGQTWLAPLFKKLPQQRPLMEGRLSVEGVHNRLLSLEAAAKIKIDKKASQYIFNPTLDFEAAINNFQGFIRFLNAKNILIPAPFSPLEGTVRISSHDLVKISATSYALPFRVAVNLASPQQVVQISLNTLANFYPKFKKIFVNVLAQVENVQLELPPLDPLKGKPRIALDRRILKTPPIKKVPTSKFKVYLSLDVRTTKPAAIRLLYTYFKPYLPITLSLHRSLDKENSGFLKTEYFQIEYLRRKVEVEKLRIDLPPSEKDPLPVDARFKIQQTQYTVFIDASGPLTKPHITLSSDPYLPESEIISVLLYDRVSNQLVSSDAETAGNVQAAIADRAIGLFGIWAFASTPIKSFSYNPVTKVYTASISLPNEVTADISTNWEEAAHVELRKRVSKNWMLTIAWIPATMETEETTNLVLQWEKRF